MTQGSDLLQALSEFDPVPCNGCTACCKGNQAVELRPEWGDDPDLYGAENLAIENQANHHWGLVLKRRPNGDCVFLKGSKCTVYNKRPAVCRAFDCRRQYLGATKQQRRELVERGVFDKKIMEAGKKRAGTVRPHPSDQLDKLFNRGGGMTEFLLDRARKSQGDT